MFSRRFDKAHGPNDLPRNTRKTFVDGFHLPLVVKTYRSRIRVNGQWRSTSVTYVEDPAELDTTLGAKESSEYPILLQQRIVGPWAGRIAADPVARGLRFGSSTHCIPAAQAQYQCNRREQAEIDQPENHRADKLVQESTECHPCPIQGLENTWTNKRDCQKRRRYRCEDGGARDVLPLQPCRLDGKDHRKSDSKRAVGWQGSRLFAIVGHGACYGRIKWGVASRFWLDRKSLVDCKRWCEITVTRTKQSKRKPVNT